ncbi:uncharacterized protein LOC133365136 [Rhineura floridana]|uniref:uncharacterized protein LOC133365136 n=1 Tax=Rhineura floridana TaxID=261503 RepID=UPI002AC7EF47|nr:uncharacterized protein LOC133365136 [Rhineura floridana]
MENLSLIKNLLTECTGQLSSLMELISLNLRGLVQPTPITIEGLELDPKTRVDREVSPSHEVSSLIGSPACGNQQRSVRHLSTSSKIHTHSKSGNNILDPTKKSLKRKNSKAHVNLKRKTKNIKTAVSSKRGSKMNFNKLFKLLERDENGHKAMVLKRQANKNKNNINKTELKQERTCLMQRPEVLPTHDTGTGPSEPQTILQPANRGDVPLIRAVDRERPQEFTLENKKWRLQLKDKDFVFINYPKPYGWLSQHDRKLHLLKFMSALVNSLLELYSIKKIDYLFYNYKSAQALVTFASASIAETVYSFKEVFLRRGIEVKRHFRDNSPALPLVTCSEGKCFVPSVLRHEEPSVGVSVNRASVPAFLPTNNPGTDNLGLLSARDMHGVGKHSVSKIDLVLGNYVPEELLLIYLLIASGRSLNRNSVRFCCDCLL